MQDSGQDNFTALVQEQVHRERAASAATEAKHLRELVQAADAGSIDAMPASKLIVSRLFADTLAALEIEVQRSGRGPGAAQRGWLREIPLDVLAVITIRTCLAFCVGTREQGCTLQKLGVGIGRRVLREVLVRKAEAANPGYMSTVHARLRDYNTTAQHHIDRAMQKALAHVLDIHAQTAVSETDLLHMGKHCVQAALTVGLLEQHRGRDRRGTRVTFLLPEEVLSLLMQYHPRITKAPNVPSVSPPIPWEGAIGGGYYTPDTQYALVRLGFDSRPGSREVVYRNLQENKRLLRVLNYLQGIPYRLDAGAVRTLTSAWEQGGAALGLPGRTCTPAPPFPLGEGWSKQDASEEELRTFSAWRRLKSDWYHHERQRLQQVLTTANLVRTLRDLGGRRVWFPVYIDFRSRMYYSGEPNPQGSDPSRSAVFFDEKKPLGEHGAFWLKVGIANAFGYDKTRFADRAAWVDKNWAELSEGAGAPNDSTLYREQADSPFVAAAAVQELTAAFASGSPARYRTGVPIHMDATCSGLQHFSAMMRDHVGAKYTNLQDPVGQMKADLYRHVAELSEQQVQKDAENPACKHQLAASIWRELGVPRSLAKRPCMTLPYGATRYSIADQCRLHVQELQAQREGCSSTALGMYMAGVLMRAMQTAVPSAAVVMRWLRERCREHPKDAPLLWKSPVGFQVVLDIRARLTKRVRVSSCGLTQVVMRDLSALNNQKRVQNSISPNLVHSLDAAHMYLTAERMQKDGLSMLAVHDSFGTHPSDVPALHKHVREAFVQMYTEHDPLQEFLNGLQQDAELPVKGDFDVRKVLQSEFFFC